MKRTPLTRRTPLTSRPRDQQTFVKPAPPPLDLDAAARALTNQAQSAAMPRRDHQPIPDPVQRAPKPKDTGFPPVVRQMILDRDDNRCAACGRNVDTGSWPGYSLQHRDNRGSGGTSDPAVNHATNGLTLCGSGTTGCHGWVEGHPRDAEQLGLAVQSWADPATVPVKTYRGWVRLDQIDSHGRPMRVPEPPNADAHTVARRKKAR